MFVFRRMSLRLHFSIQVITLKSLFLFNDPQTHASYQPKKLLSSPSSQVDRNCPVFALSVKN